MNKKIKAKVRSTDELERQIMETKYGWKNNKPINIEFTDIWRIAVIAICLLGTYMFTEITWSPFNINILNWPALIAIGLVITEILFYFLAIRGQKTKASFSEIFGFKLLSGFGAIGNMLLYPVYLIIIPILGFVYLNQVWTNKERYRNYCKKKS